MYFIISELSYGNPFFTFLDILLIFLSIFFILDLVWIFCFQSSVGIFGLVWDG